MKNLTLLLFTFLILASTSCNTEEQSAKLNSDLIGGWNLESISGGFIGLNCEYDLGDIVWEFKEEDVLEVTVNAMITSQLCQGNYTDLGTEIYTYSVFENNDRVYLSVDGVERGELDVNENMFFINGNNTTVGDGADGIGTSFIK